MFKVIFKGNLPEITLSHQEGEKLKEFLKTAPPDAKIELDGNLVSVSAIKAVYRDGEGDILQNSMESLKDFYAKEERKYQVLKDEMLALPPRKRAEESYQFIRFIWLGVTGKKITDVELAQAIDAAEAWFTDHKDFHLPNPIAFIPREFLTRRIAGMPRGKDEALQLKDALALHTLNLADKALNS